MLPLLVALALGACSGRSDAPRSRDCINNPPLNLCLDNAHIGLRVGTASNVLDAMPTDVYVLVDERGELRVIGTSGVDIVGSITSSDAGDVTGAITAFAQPGFSFANGATTGMGSVRGRTNLITLELDWSIATGETGTLSSEITLGNFSGANAADVAGLWRWIDTTAGLDVIITIAGDGDLFGQASNGCTFDGRILTDGSNIVDIEFDVAVCAGLDGGYGGLGSYELADQNGAPGPMADTIRIHVNTLQRVITGRWERT
jgi:hypothetical protein